MAVKTHKSASEILESEGYEKLLVNKSRVNKSRPRIEQQKCSSTKAIRNNRTKKKDKEK